MLVLGLPASAASDLEAESFRGTDVASSVWVAGGDACLTAGTDLASLPIPGCDLESPDPVGAGALRLTPIVPSATGHLLHNREIPTTSGLDIEFTMIQWGGTAADGIAFFFTKGGEPLENIGAGGGALGYSPGGDGGLPHALLGIGFDALGNFSNFIGGEGCGIPPVPEGFFPHSIVVRGPGNGESGYCLLDYVKGSEVGFTLSSSYWDADTEEFVAGTRVGGTRLVRIQVDPSDDPSPSARVWLDSVLVIEFPLPAEYLAESTVRFGFTAANGQQYDFHEIRDFSVVTIETLPATGASPRGVLVWATLLLAVGTGVMYVGRRRRRSVA